MWLFDIFFSKNDFNDILRLAFGHKETNRGNVHIVCKSRLSPRQEFVPQNLKSTLFLFPETGTTTNLCYFNPIKHVLFFARPISLGMLLSSSPSS
jgi:hypothetical protein